MSVIAERSRVSRTFRSSHEAARVPSDFGVICLISLIGLGLAALLTALNLGLDMSQLVVAAG